MKLATIFSTGDAGAARGALDAADELGLKVGGWTAVTALPAAYVDRLRPTLAPRMAARLNVQDSDGTLIVSFAPVLAAGGPAAYADEAVEQQRKSSLHVVLPEGGRSTIPEGVRKGVLAWIAEEKIATLHVTGPREADEPGIQQAVRDALVWIFEDEVSGTVPPGGPAAPMPEVSTPAGPSAVASLQAVPIGMIAPAGVDRSALAESRCGRWLESGERCDRHAAMDGRIGWRCPAHHRAPFAGVDRATAPESLRLPDAEVVRLAAELAEAGGQPTHIAINPANVDAAIAAGMDVQWRFPTGAGDIVATVDVACADCIRRCFDGVRPKPRALVRAGVAHATPLDGPDVPLCEARGEPSVAPALGCVYCGRPFDRPGLPGYDCASDHEAQPEA